MRAQATFFFIKYWTLGMMVICFVWLAPGVCILLPTVHNLIIHQLMNLPSPATVSQGGETLST